MLWGFLLLMPDHQAEGPNAGLRTLTLVGEPLQYNYSPVCGLPTWAVWDLIVTKVPLLPSRCDFVFECKISFLLGLSLFC